MNRSERENARLGEVTAVLRRLQRISDVTGADEAPNAEQTPSLRTRRAILAAGVAVAVVVPIVGAALWLRELNRPVPRAVAALAQPKAAPREAVLDRKPAAAPEGSAAPRYEIPATPPASQPPASQPPAPTATGEPLEVALGLLQAGRVQAARQRLLSLSSGGAADVAWALARSYDPNFLRTIPTADAAPSIEEATRWYRTWYAAAVKQGLVADSVSLERIIGSMR
jgi:hypothetical protein